MIGFKRCDDDEMNARIKANREHLSELLPGDVTYVPTPPKARYRLHCGSVWARPDELLWWIEDLEQGWNSIAFSSTSTLFDWLFNPARGKWFA